MIAGIVGSEDKKFTRYGQQNALAAIHDIVSDPDVHLISSGRCHLGGIDIWAETCAMHYGKLDESLIFPPKVYNWSQGYMPRNLQIAQASHKVYCIVPDVLPREYEGMKFPQGCYHCLRHREPHLNHVKSGGCWTMWKAKEFGKLYELVIVRNYE